MTEAVTIGESQIAHSKFFVSRILILSSLTAGFYKEIRANPIIPEIQGGGGGDCQLFSIRRVEAESGRKIKMAIDNVPRCQHVKANGTPCGSPALRRRRHCFFHERIRRERAKIAADTSAQRGFDLPLLEDANSVQVALMKTIQMLGSGRMDHRTAGLILYALQTASVNLRNAEFEVRRSDRRCDRPRRRIGPRSTARSGSKKTSTTK